MSVRIIRGDVRDGLLELADNSVHCVVTSPPYWALRDYGTATWEGGDARCDHLAPLPGGFNASGLAKYPNGLNADTIADKIKQRQQQYRDVCAKCDAKRVDRQLGLEATPEGFVATMVEVFREVRRVLHPMGTCWVNMGDSYAGARRGGSSAETSTLLGSRQNQEQSRIARKAALCDSRRRDDEPIPRSDVAIAGLKPKDMVGMPWRLAFALQADGWWLRSDIIWEKPNPMPESTRDRPTKSHEYVFLLTKSERYFYDADAVKEPMSDVSLKRLSQPNVLDQPGGPKDSKEGNRSHKKAINNQAERLIRHEKWKTRFEGWDAMDKSLGRNKRTVWKIATFPFPEAHFATFPPELPETCIKAGSSERGVCATCGAPWMRISDVSYEPSPIHGEASKTGKRRDMRRDGPSNEQGGEGLPRLNRVDTTVGWAASCDHDGDPVPAVVLDPFGGAGTTGLVADRLQRDAILIELNPAYADMAERRIRGDAPLFAQVGS